MLNNVLKVISAVMEEVCAPILMLLLVSLWLNEWDISKTAKQSK